MARLDFPNYTIEGHSKAGVETNIRIPQLSLNLDIGRCPLAALRMENLVISHGHPDHIAGLAYYVATRQFYGMSVPRIFLPHFLHDQIERLLQLWAEIQGYPMKAELIALQPGQTVQFRRDMLLEALEVQHRIGAFGYVLYTRRQKLKADYLDLPQTEIVRLKNEGADLFFEQVTPVIGYSGDTLIDAIDEHPVFKRCEILIMETTFLDERRRGRHRARKGGHIHLSELVERAESFENDAIILIHFSQAYRPAEIREIIQRECPPELHRRIKLLLRD